MSAADDPRMAAALTVAESYAGQPDVDSVYLAGSLTAGLGNVRSDVDLFVVTKGEADSSPTQHHVDGYRVDVEQRQIGWLDEVAQRFPDYQITKRTYTDIIGPLFHYDEAIRLMLSQPVRSSPTYERSRQILTKQRGVLRKLLVTRFTADYLNSLEDCVGALESGDFDSGLVISHQLLLAAAQAFLAGCEDFYIGDKWIPPKLRRSAPQWDSVILDALFPPSSTQLDKEAAVRERVRLAQTLTVAAQTLGWDSPDAARFPLRPSGIGGGPRRAITGQGWRASDGAVLGDLGGRQIHVSAEGLMLWGLCDGRPRDVVVAQHAAMSGVSVTDVDAYLDQLIGRGLVGPAA
jgi:hypothetical protein